MLTSQCMTRVGSRRHTQSTLSQKSPVLPSETVLSHMDDPINFYPFQRYNDTKLLCVMFMYEIAPRLEKGEVVLNMVCPGMVDTGMSDILPVYLRVPVNIMKAVKARSVEQGTWLILNSMLVAGGASHGEFLADKDVQG